MPGGKKRERGRKREKWKRTFKKKNKEKSLRSRQTESWWPELCVIPFMSLDWPVLLCQPKQQHWGGPTLPLLPSSLPRAHPTDRMNNKPNVCLRQREREKHDTKPAISVKIHVSKNLFCDLFSLLLSLLLVNHYHHHLGTGISHSHYWSCTPTHRHECRQTMIHQLAACPGVEN